MIYIIIYLIGYVLAYYMGRFLIKSMNRNNYGWIDVIFLAIYSAFSWFTLIILFIIFLFSKADNTNSKPPRWL